MQRDVTAAPRPCPRCGGALRFDHREYAGKGRSAAVLRCRDCGDVIRTEARSDEERVATKPARDRRARRGDRVPVDQPPPGNPLLDERTAEMLRQAFADDASRDF